MHKEFYIGLKDGEYSHSLDVSSFTSLEELTGTLADVFGFADTKCEFLLSCRRLEEQMCLFVLRRVSFHQRYALRVLC